MVITCYNYHNPKDSQRIYSYLHQLTQLGGPPKVGIQWLHNSHVWSSCSPWFLVAGDSVSFHIPIIWLVCTPLCWWLLMLNHQGQKPKPTYPIVSWKIVSLMKFSIIRFIHVQPFLWAPRISWYTHRPWMHLMRFWSVLWLHDGKVYRTPLQFMVLKHIFLCMFFFTPINWN